MGTKCTHKIYTKNRTYLGLEVKTRTFVNAK